MSDQIQKHRSVLGSAPVISAATVLVLIACAALAPWIAPHDPFDTATINLMNGFSRPLQPNAFTGETFILGTDDQGRDLLSAILSGLRISLFVGLSAVALAAVIGVSLGLIAANAGKRMDSLIMRLADIQLTFPSLLVALLIFGIVRGFTPAQAREATALWVLIAAIGLSEWVQFARVVRAVARVELSMDYVVSAKLSGRSSAAILFAHVLPNTMGPIIVMATINLALAVIAEATLSYLGVGVPPTTPSLGTLIRIGQGFLFSGEWWILFFPAATLLALSLSINSLGDWLRDRLDPRSTIR